MSALRASTIVADADYVQPQPIAEVLYPGFSRSGTEENANDSDGPRAHRPRPGLVRPRSPAREDRGAHRARPAGQARPERARVLPARRAEPTARRRGRPSADEAGRRRGRAQ